MDQSVVIAGYKRSPFHFAGKGALARVRPDDLAASVIKALIEESGIDPAAIEDLALGCAFPEAEQGFNLARIVGRLAGLPVSVAGVTINRWCGSSMSAVHYAAGMIQMGAGEAFLCGGVESMSRVPMGGFNPMPNPRLMETYPQIYMNMGETAENLAREFQISREEQDRFAFASQKKAAAARDAGLLRAEIAPFGDVAEDGCIRGETSLEGLAGLKPAFLENGTVTAGTSSPLTDGASAVLVTSEDFARGAGLKIMARLRSVAVAGCKAETMGYGPVPASRKALERAGLTIGDIDLVELNEAFAAQSIPVVRDLGIDEARLNLHGGAIALGHPLGASGARITGKAASLLQTVKDGKGLALATMCIGGGQGTALILEAV